MLSNFIRKITNRVTGFLSGNRKASEQALLSYRSIYNSVGTAGWEMEIDVDLPIGSANIVTWSKEFREMLGFEDEREFPNVMSSLKNRLHPDDKNIFSNAILSVIEDYTETIKCDIEYRILKKNNKYGHYRASATSIRNNKGIPVKIIGVQIDVSVKQNLEDMIQINSDNVARKQKIIGMLQELGNTLSIANKSSFNKALIKCLGMVGEIFNTDRVQIWKNETVGTNKHFSLTNEWLSDLGTRLAASSKYAETYPYDAVPGWEEKLGRGRNINGPISDLLPHEYAFFNRQSVKSLIVIPLFEGKAFKGFLRIDDCRNTRELTNDEMTDIDLVGQFIMFSQSINDKMNTIIIEADKITEMTSRHNSVLDAVPVPIIITDADMNLVYINSAAESMTGKHRYNIQGTHCSNLNTVICNTLQCGIICAKRFVNRTYFKNYGKYYQVDVTGIKDEAGEIKGYVEVIQDISTCENRHVHFRNDSE